MSKFNCYAAMLKIAQDAKPLSQMTLNELQDHLRSSGLPDHIKEVSEEIRKRKARGETETPRPATSGGFRRKDRF